MAGNPPRLVAIGACIVGIGAGAVLMSMLSPDTDYDVDGAALARARQSVPRSKRARGPVTGWTPPDFELPAVAGEPPVDPNAPPPKSPAQMQAEIEAAVAEGVDQGEQLYTADLGGISRAVKDKDSAIQACARSATGYRGNEGPQGRVTLGFTIVPDPEFDNVGVIESVIVEGNKEPDVFDQCLTAVFKTMDFRSPPGEGLDMRWPVFIK